MNRHYDNDKTAKIGHNFRKYRIQKFKDIKKMSAIKGFCHLDGVRSTL